MRRDGPCRLRNAGFGPCDGAQEWAHFGEKQRWKTRGMDPEERHTVDGSLALCTRHHGLYDRGPLELEALTDQGTNGRLRATMGDVTAEV